MKPSKGMRERGQTDQVTVDSTPLVGVIIPTHNRWALAEEAIRSLLSDDYPAKTIYLVDDGSVDGTADACREKYPQVRICKGDGDLWWSGAINLGLERALGDGVDLIAWFNDDNRVERSTISEMVVCHQRHGQDTIIAARTVSTVTGIDEWAGDPPRWHPDYGRWQPSPSLPAVPGVGAGAGHPVRKLDHPPGGRGVLFPATCFKTVGQIDQRRFPHYWADHDFHYRAMKFGYRYLLAERAVVWNRPNQNGQAPSDQFSWRWCFNFLLSRRSAMNLPTLRRLLRRHLAAAEYRAIWYPIVWRSLTWLASGWVNRHPRTRRSIRGTWRLLNLLREGFRGGAGQ
ncbi:MAG: glycosyltransferase family 2 protein [Acidobacteriota bacterium]